jgi:hypothetical protein
VVFAPVVDIVPPSATFAHWCIGVPHPDVAGGDYIVLFYIRDVGDGVSSFDEIAAGGDFGATCATFPAPISGFQPLLQGDYKTSIKVK